MVKAWAILGITSWKWSSCVRTVCSKISAVGPEPAFKYLKRVPSPSLAYSISPDGDQVLMYSLFGLDSVRIVSSSRYLPGLPERPSCAVRSTLARISPRIESTVKNQTAPCVESLHPRSDAPQTTGIRAFRNSGAVRRPLGIPDELVGEVGDIAPDGLGVDQAHGFLVAGLAEEALAGPEHDREDLQPQLVDEVVLHQRAQELEAGGDDDFPLELVLQLRDLLHHVATAGWPPRGEPLVAPPTQQQGLGAQGLVERELAEFWAVLDQADPAPDPEAFVTGGVLDDSVERDIVADHDLSHLDSPFCVRWTR